MHLLHETKFKCTSTVRNRMSKWWKYATAPSYQYPSVMRWEAHPFGTIKVSSICSITRQLIFNLLEEIRWVRIVCQTKTHIFLQCIVLRTLWATLLASTSVPLAHLKYCCTFNSLLRIECRNNILTQYTADWWQMKNNNL